MWKRNTAMLKPLAIAAALAASTPALAYDCTLSGTYLTIKSHDVAADVVKVGRTLLSFLPEGNAVMIDAAQGGITGFQPFSPARGAWRCEPAGSNGEPFEAVVVDFTFPTAGEPDAQIARVDISGTLAEGTIKGTATISFYPLAGDPTDRAAGTNRISYEFRGIPIALDPN